jgi:hypothetical protein
VVLVHIAKQHVLRTETYCAPILGKNEFSAGKVARTRAGDDTEALLQITAVGVNCGSEVLVHGDGREGGAGDDEGWICLPYFRHLRRVTFRHVGLENSVDRLEEWNRLCESPRIPHAPASQPAIIQPMPSCAVQESHYIGDPILHGTSPT